MYEQSFNLADAPVADGEVSTTSLVLVPGTVGNNVYRRKVVGSTSNGLPTTIDIRGDILAPSGARKYSVFRVTVTVNEIQSQNSLWGPPPVSGTTVSFNVPFGAIGELSISFEAACERARVHLGWMLQYYSGASFSTTAGSGEAALFSDIFAAADFASAMAKLADGVR